MLINEFDSIDKLFFTLTVILVTTNIIYQLMIKFDRPIVLGGIMAGVIIHHFNIPAKYFDISTCAGLGQMGIVMFMMIVGNQLDYKKLFIHKTQMPLTVLNMLIPFILGFLFAGFLLHNQSSINGPYQSFITNYSGSSTNTANIADPHLNLMFQIFIGLTISMTAFPILSMFLRQTNLADTRIGNIALICGFVDEVLFWIILGVILIASQKNDIITSFAPIDFIAYLVFIIIIAPRLLAYIVSKIKQTSTMLGFLIIGCFASAALADSVNLHQVFGGFLFGLILPRDNEMIKSLRKNLFLIINTVLLPIYFVETGITANIHISINYITFVLLLTLTFIALFGKFGGAFLTGKLMGASNTESVLLGSLLNMRGIIEIVLLNVGLDIGIINDRIYTILLTMTMLCTFFATSISLHLRKKLLRTKAH